MKRFTLGVCLVGLGACQQESVPLQQQHTQRNFLIKNKVIQLYYLSERELGSNGFVRQLKEMERQWAIRVTVAQAKKDEEVQKILLDWNSRPVDVLWLAGERLHALWGKQKITSSVKNRKVLFWESGMKPKNHETILRFDRQEARNLADSLCKTFACENERIDEFRINSRFNERNRKKTNDDKQANSCLVIVDKKCLHVRMNVPAVLKAAVDNKLKRGGRLSVGVKSGYLVYEVLPGSGGKVETTRVEQALKLWLLTRLSS